MKHNAPQYAFRREATKTGLIQLTPIQATL